MSAHFPHSLRSSSVGGVAYRFPFRLVPRLACLVLCGVLCLFFAACSLIRFISSVRWRLVTPSRPAARSRLVCYSSVFRLVRFISSPSRPISSCSCVLPEQSVFSFRLGVSWGGSCSCVLFFLFSAYPSAASHVHGDGRRLVSPMPRGGVPLFPLLSVIVGSWRWRDGRARSTIRSDVPFYSVRFPHQCGDEATRMRDRKSVV